MLIPEDTELPPDYIQKGNVYPIGINVANDARKVVDSFQPHCSGILSVS